MKVLITTDWYAPVINGVVTSVLLLQRELVARGHDVRVVTLSNSLHTYKEGPVYYMGSVSAGKIYPGARLKINRARSMMQELIAWHPDVIHSQCEFSTFFLARRIAEELDIPLVHTYHTVYEDYTHYFSPSVHFGKKAAAVFTRWAASHTDCLIAPTAKVRLLLQGYGVSKPVFVVPSGIDLGHFQAEPDVLRRNVLKASLNIPQDRTVLVFVGRLAEEKRVEELLRFRAGMGPGKVPLLLVGDGPDRNRLESVAADLGLGVPDVVFAGMVPAEQVADWYQLGDLFVSASTSETQGLTYAEALAAGVPVLCRADPCLLGVVRDGENGWQYHGEAEFRQRLEDFLAHPQRREALCRAARETGEEYSAQRFAERVESIYLEQIERGSLRRIPA